MSQWVACQNLVTLVEIRTEEGFWGLQTVLAKSCTFPGGVTHTHTLPHAHARTHARARTHAQARHAHVRTHARTHAHTQARNAHARTHTHTHARTRTHAHTQAGSSSLTANTIKRFVRHIVSLYSSVIYLIRRLIYSPQRKVAVCSFLSSL